MPARPLGIIAGPSGGLRTDSRSEDHAEPRAYSVAGAALGFSLLLIASGLLYPILGTPSRLDQSMPGSPAELTLNGLAWMNGSWIETDRGERIDFTGDLAAIEWLRANAGSHDVLLEASIGPYRGNGSRIVAGTGLPAVLGWDRHERQQRYEPGIDARLRDVRLFYTTADQALKQRILDEYQVRYVIVGDVERYWRVAAGFAGAVTNDEPYSTPAGLAAIDQMVGTDLRIAFRSGDTTVYEVIPFPWLAPTLSGPADTR
jgi:uncharacterized membrane protein